ncbi:hypothetical protein [Paenibacillus camerounensis]|uniref:hypothetical protein n=1 Tax=Paenibacillus camerounensis TaxID=1243663 RepID=UPI0005A623C3|nr:hypothetical protein [Paenibacillus camerounensis]
MNKLKKILKYSKEPKVLLRKVIHRLPKGGLRKNILSFPSEDELSYRLESLMRKYEGKTVYVFPSPNCPWGYMFQRPQQLARALAREGNLIFYMTDTSYPYSPDWNVRGFLEVEPNIYLFNDDKDNVINQLASRKVIVWQYWPHQNDYVKKLKVLNKQLIHVYDCIDDITTFDSYGNIQNDYYESVVNSNLTLATSNQIYNQVKTIRNDVIYVPNGVEVGDFDRSLEEIPSVQLIRKKFSYIIGYYGAIADWFDFELLKYLADNNPKNGFVIVGEVYKEIQFKVEDFKGYNNVFFMKRISYEMIPSLLDYFDVAIIPFLINDITLSTSPVKAFEYLAGGKEIVSTELPEVKGIRQEFVAENYIEFQNKLELALNRINDSNRIAFLKSLAIQNTWKERVSRVTKAISNDRSE